MDNNIPDKHIEMYIKKILTVISGYNNVALFLSGKRGAFVDFMLHLSLLFYLRVAYVKLI